MRHFLAWGLLWSSVALAQRPATFMGPGNFGSGTAMSMAIADFNGDGNPDVATAGTDVTVYLGDGHGSFRAEPGIGLASTSVVTADFNGDGIPDLAVASGFTPGGIFVLLGNGDGTFGTPVFYPGYAFYLVLGDFNGDGNVDIAGFGYPTNQLQVFFGAADGGFQPGPVTTLPSGALAMASADFNLDNKADLALTLQTASYAAEVAVLFGKGDGTFASPALYPENNMILGPSLVSADFNQDGAPDLAYTGYTNRGYGTVNVLPNDGRGNFGAPITTAIATTNLSALAAADLNGDGILDVLAASDGLGSVLLGAGDGTFKLGEQFMLAYYSVFVGIGDFNRDGIPDVVSVNNPGSGTGLQPPLTMVLGAGKGRFRSARAFDTGGSPGQPALGDFNGDGKLDVAVANTSFLTVGKGSIAVLLGDGEGGLGRPTLYPANKPTALAVSDVNHDGKPDLVFLEENAVAAMPGNGDGTFGTAVTTACKSCANLLLVADFNHDGKPDVATYLASSTSGTLGILLGNGDGTFQPPVAYGFGALNSVAAADFNHDGHLDLVATFYLSGAYILMGNGDGTFGAPIPLNSQATFAMTADLNNDGNADIIVNTLNSYGLGIYLGLGNGKFSPPISVNAQVLTPTLLAGDFNGDGIADLLGGAEFNLLQTGFSQILLGTGGAHYTSESRQFPIGTTALAAGDFNGDGKLDIASVGPADPFYPLTNSTVWIILNSTAP